MQDVAAPILTFSMLKSISGTLCRRIIQGTWDNIGHCSDFCITAYEFSAGGLEVSGLLLRKLI